MDEDDEIDNLMEYDGEMGESKKDDWYKEPRDEMRGVAVAVMPETNVYAARPDRMYFFKYENCQKFGLLYLFRI